MFNSIIIKYRAYMKKHSLKIISVISILFVVGCWLYTYSVLKDLESTDRGTFGDMFGGVNALFSGLAFCGIIITILLQSSELRLQREEIKANRAELERTTNVQIEQGKSLNRQAENLKISAKLSAMNTLVNYYSEKASDANKTIDMIEKNRTNFYLDKAEKYIQEIERIVNQKGGV
jgi:DNA-binding XRE family transcriptional regulator